MANCHANADTEHSGCAVTFTDTNANCRANVNTERSGGTVTFADANANCHGDAESGKTQSRASRIGFGQIHFPVEHC